MLDEPIQEGQGPKINGSVMMAQADTKEEVMEKIKGDVYFKSGVWDESKVSACFLLDNWSATYWHGLHMARYGDPLNQKHDSTNGDDTSGRVRLLRSEASAQPASRTFLMRNVLTERTDPDLPIQERNTESSIALYPSKAPRLAHQVDGYW